MSCAPGYKLIGDMCVLLPKISPWGKEPYMIRVYNPESDQILEISVSLDLKMEKVRFKASMISH